MRPAPFPWSRELGGCPRCRSQLVRRLKGEPWTEPGAGPGLPVRHVAATTAMIAVAAVTVIAAGVSAYGQYSAAQAQARAAEYNAALMMQQAEYQAQQAAYVTQQAQFQAAYQEQLAGYQGRLLERQATGVLTMAAAEASLAEQQAIAAEAAGRVRESAIHRAYERTQSDVRAAIGKAGVDTTGSPLLVLMENADTVGQELAVNEYRTALDVAGARASGSFAGTEGALRAAALRDEAGYARFGGAVAAAGTRLAGASGSREALNAATGLTGQAGLLRFQAGGYRTAGYLNAGSTLLGGLAAAGSPYLRYGQASSMAYPRYAYP